MKSVWSDEWLIPGALALLGRERAARWDRLRDRRAERDVRGGVLVEERVVEDEAGLSDPRAAVDERDLAEPRGAVVARDVRADQVLALVGVDLDRAAVLEADPEAAHRRVPWSCSG